MNFLGIIPSRYGSTRFPGKPLAMIGDKPMIQWVYERSSSVLDEIYVATDDQRIYDAVIQFGGNAVMTSEKHRSGTDRCAEALAIITSGTGISADVIVNIQGDEPFIDKNQIGKLKQCFEDEKTQIATLIQQIHQEEDVFNENKPKVIKGKSDYAIYFSRSPIPFFRGGARKDWLIMHNYYKHIGIYAYRSDILREITGLPQSSLELAESLEQLRWIENGYRIKVAEVENGPLGIDTPEDLEKARKLLSFYS